MKVGAPSTTFAPSDTIYASVSTNTSDPAASVPGTLKATWTFEDGQVVNEESKSVNLTGAGNTEFHIAKPDGFPAGSYKVEISLDGNVVQSKDFSVKRRIGASAHGADAFAGNSSRQHFYARALRGLFLALLPLERGALRPLARAPVANALGGECPPAPACGRRLLLYFAPKDIRTRV